MLILYSSGAVFSTLVQLLSSFYLWQAGLFLYDRDHAGGNEKIKQLIPGIKVYGGSVDNVKGCTDKVENGDKIAMGKDTSILALHTPWYYCNTLCDVVLWNANITNLDFFFPSTTGLSTCCLFYLESFI